jgi:hypothetical protein
MPPFRLRTRPPLRPLDRLDRGDDAEGAVELAAFRNRAQMGPRPDPALSGDCPRTMAEKVAGLVDLDLESASSSHIRARSCAASSSAE